VAVLGLAEAAVQDGHSRDRAVDRAPDAGQETACRTAPSTLCQLAVQLAAPRESRPQNRARPGADRASCGADPEWPEGVALWMVADVDDVPGR
jgi:hypothetical protein